MSHRIIISSSKAFETQTSFSSSEPSEVSVDVTYEPSHDLTEEQVGDRVAKLLKLIKQMQG